MNADTGVGERGLKHWAKKPARSARKGSIDVFTESTTNQVVDTMILRKASDVMNIGNHMFTCTQSHTRTLLMASIGTVDNIKGVLVGEPKFKLVGHLVEDQLECTCIWFGETATKNKTGLPIKVAELLEEEYFIGDENKHRIRNESGCNIFGYTEYRLPNGDIVRAHPDFRSEGPFYDWCIIPDPNDEYDYAVQHLAQNKRKVLDHFLRCPRLSKVEEKWGLNHVPSCVLALFKHPETGIAMALVLPC
jgi:hypothetical protein